MPFVPEQPEPPAKAFDLATPSHVYWKLLWELSNLKRSKAEEDKREELRFNSAYHAFNFAVTAWHLIDWVWHGTDDSGRKYISEYFGGIELKRRGQLFEAIAEKYRAIHICGQIANGSKHFAPWGEDPAIEAKVLWIESDGEAQPDHQARFSFQKKLAIRDGDEDFRPALDVFKEAVRNWDSMLGTWGFIEGGYIGPDADPPPWA
ncbi:MAG TPA: hypothetical protein VGL35_02420 [Rhizomicrobium sp.]|jgi:hypothetical protein